MHRIAVIGSWGRAAELAQPLPHIAGKALRLIFHSPGETIRADVVLVDDEGFRSIVDQGFSEEIPIIVATAKPAAGASLLFAGADAVIALPIDAAELASASFSLLTPGRYLSRRVIATLVRDARSSRNDACSPLSLREVEVLRELAAGSSDAEIARSLYVSIATVHSHILNLRRKLGARNRTHAVVLAIEHGIIPPHAPAAVAK